jgi:DNA-directed RNA polymerase subunit RPC12/RpoP
MFEDQDLWPVQCPNCGYETKKEIGWLKTNRRVQCPGCRANLWHHPETFIDRLDDARRAVEDFNRGIKMDRETP